MCGLWIVVKMCYRSIARERGSFDGGLLRGWGRDGEALRGWRVFWLCLWKYCQISFVVGGTCMGDKRVR